MPYLQLSIFTTIDGLGSKLVDLENRLRNYLNQTWQRLTEWNLLDLQLDKELKEMDGFQFLVIVHNATQNTQVGYLRSGISELTGKIMYIQSQLELEIGAAERDVLNLQEFQLDILLATN